MTSSSVKNNLLPPGLVSNLQEVLLRKKVGEEGDQSKEQPADSSEPTTSAAEAVDVDDGSKPIVLVTNGDGIDSPGLTSLVEALVSQGLYHVHVCAPQSLVLFLSSYFLLIFQMGIVYLLVFLSGLLISLNP